VLQQLDLADGAQIEPLRSQVEALQGRPLKLIGVGDRDLPCGMWVRTAQTDLVFYAETTAPAHQRHIIAHELAHILLGHSGAELTEQAGGLLFQRIEPTTVARVLNRADYDTSAEREAELLATLLLQRRPRPAVESDDRVRRLAASMGDAPPGP
jgi:Zn-dependent peptidase ImmA (M78 family)